MVDFGSGPRELLQAIGEDGAFHEAPQLSRLQRALRRARHVRATLVNRELGTKVLKIGGAVLAGASGVAAIVAQMSETQRKTAEQRFRAAVKDLLGNYFEVFGRAGSMTSDDYLREFRPRMAHLLGQLEGTSAPTNELAVRHGKLVSSLQRQVDELDAVVSRASDGDEAAIRRQLERLLDAVGRTLEAYSNWLEGGHLTRSYVRGSRGE